jgi:hypothetical protein
MKVLLPVLGAVFIGFFVVIVASPRASKAMGLPRGLALFVLMIVISAFWLLDSCVRGLSEIPS